MRGLLVGFHYCPVLLSGVALFLVAFSSSLHTDLSRDEVFERDKENTWMFYISLHGAKCHGRKLGSDDIDFGCIMINLTWSLLPPIRLCNNLTILLIGNQFSIPPSLYCVGHSIQSKLHDDKMKHDCVVILGFDVTGHITEALCADQISCGLRCHQDEKWKSYNSQSDASDTKKECQLRNQTKKSSPENLRRNPTFYLLWKRYCWIRCLTLWKS